MNKIEALTKSTIQLHNIIVDLRNLDYEMPTYVDGEMDEAEERIVEAMDILRRITDKLKNAEEKENKKQERPPYPPGTKYGLIKRSNLQYLKTNLKQ